MLTTFSNTAIPRPSPTFQLPHKLELFLTPARVELLKRDSPPTDPFHSASLSSATTTASSYTDKNDNARNKVPTFNPTTSAIWKPSGASSIPSLAVTPSKMGASSVPTSKSKDDDKDNNIDKDSDKKGDKKGDDDKKSKAPTSSPSGSVQSMTVTPSSMVTTSVPSSSSLAPSKIVSTLIPTSGPTNAASIPSGSVTSTPSDARSSASFGLGSDLMNFVVFGGNAVIFGSDKTVLTSGSVGVSPGTSITGNYMLIDGTTEMQTQSSIAAASELATAYNTGSALACEHSLLTGDLSGDTLSGGVYCSGSGMFSIADMGVLVLDAHNVSGVTWIFHVSGDMSTGANSKVILKNGASAANVYWIVGGTVSVGHGSSMVGNILSPSTITIGASASLDGRALSETIVIFIGDSIAHLPVVPAVYTVPSSVPSMFPTFASTESPISLFPSSQPSFLSSAPTSLMNIASLCVISSIPSQFNQSTWSGTDASEAMMQAIAISMGVPVSMVHCGYADQLCRESPTGAPTLRPTMVPTESVNFSEKTSVAIESVRKVLDDGLFASNALTISSIHRRSPVHPDIASRLVKLLSFSIYRAIPGKQYVGRI